MSFKTDGEVIFLFTLEIFAHAVITPDIACAGWCLETSNQGLLNMMISILSMLS